MIELKNVTFDYNKDKQILSDVSLCFEQGKMYSIVGPSGVGKSTLLSLISGLEKPQSGEIYFDGEKSDFEENIRKHNISLVFQNFLLFPYMNSIQNVVTAVEIKDKDGKNQEKKAKEILLSLGLYEKDLNRSVKKLSGGEQQRVAIARAIAVKSKYILADEPTGNLDEDNAEIIVSMLKNLARKHNCCVIIVTHSDYVKEQSDKSFKFSRGKIEPIKT